VKYTPPPGIFEIDEPLVDLRTAIPGIQIELPYGTRRNVAGTKLYPADMVAMLDRPTAAKLQRVHVALSKHGRGLKVWDAYRPPEVQWELWRRSGRSGYVADPRLWWSKHCSGRAVDVTLFDLESGRELPMPSKFDDFSERAASDYSGSSPAVRENLTLLKAAMRKAGFVGIQMEWWHYANADHYNKNIAPVPAAEAGVDLSHLGDIKRF
jgi:D-alanyl-D-alanine dipeptidase